MGQVRIVITISIANHSQKKYSSQKHFNVYVFAGTQTGVSFYDDPYDTFGEIRDVVQPFECNSQALHSSKSYKPHANLFDANVHYDESGADTDNNICCVNDR